MPSKKSMLKIALVIVALLILQTNAEEETRNKPNTTRQENTAIEYRPSQQLDDPMDIPFKSYADFFQSMPEWLDQCIVHNFSRFHTEYKEMTFTCGENNEYIVKVIKQFDSNAKPILFSIKHDKWESHKKMIFKGISEVEARIEFVTHKLIHELNEYFVEQNLFKRDELSLEYAIHYIKSFTIGKTPQAGVFLEFVEGAIDFNPKHDEEECKKSAKENGCKCINTNNSSRHGFLKAEDKLCPATYLKRLDPKLTYSQYKKLGDTVVHTTIMNLVLGIADNKPGNVMYTKNDGFFRIDYGYVMMLGRLYPWNDTDLIRLVDPVWDYLNDHRVLDYKHELLAPTVVLNLKRKLDLVKENFNGIVDKINQVLNKIERNDALTVNVLDDYAKKLETFLNLPTYRKLAGIHMNDRKAKEKYKTEATARGIKWLKAKAESLIWSFHSEPLNQWPANQSQIFWEKTIKSVWTQDVRNISDFDKKRIIECWVEICGKELENCFGSQTDHNINLDDKVRKL